MVFGRRFCHTIFLSVITAAVAWSGQQSSSAAEHGSIQWHQESPGAG